MITKKKTINILLLSFIFFSCAENNKNKNPKNIEHFNLKDKIQRCHNGVGLACSEVAYYYRMNNETENEIIYNQMGCNLKEESACFNLNDSKQLRSYSSAVWLKLNFYREQIAACHKTKIDYKMPKLEKNIKIIMFTTKFSVNNQGTPENITINVQNSKNLNFETCALNIVKKIKFPIPSIGDDKNIIIENVFRYDNSYLNQK